jgi:membrane protein
MWNLLRHLWSHFSNEDLNLTAAALAYTTVLSIVPFLAVTLTALNYFGALDTVTPKVESILLNNFNGTAGTEGVAMMKKGISRIREGRTGSLVALLLILVATRLMFGLEKAFHKIWLIKNQRPLFKRLLYYWLFLLIFPFILAAWVWFASHLGRPFWQSSFLRPGYIVTFVLLYVLQVWLPSVRVGAIQALIGTAASVVLLFFL